MPKRACVFVKPSGEPCNAMPTAEGGHCFWQSPDHTEEAAEARRLGGLRRRREGTLAGTYAFEGLGDVGQIRRLLEVAAFDTLGLENSVARSRTLAYLAQVALKALEVGELEARVAALEASVRGQSLQPESVFDVLLDDDGNPFVLEVTEE